MFLRLQIWLLVCAALVLSACAGYAPEANPPAPVAPVPAASADSAAPNLAGSAWTAAFVDGAGATRGNWPQLRWTSADRVAGTGGCNNFVGAVERTEGGLRFGQLAATGKLCMTEPGGQEDKFFRALELTRQLRVSGSQLHLLDAAGKTLATLERLN